MVVFCNLQQNTKNKVGLFSCNGCDPYTLICCKKSHCEHQIETPPIKSSNKLLVPAVASTNNSTLNEIIFKFI